jgi:hypothetical protein
MSVYSNNNNNDKSPEKYFSIVIPITMNMCVTKIRQKAFYLEDLHRRFYESAASHIYSTDATPPFPVTALTI